MTAALILEPRDRIETRRLVAVKREPDLIALAREGDEQALAELFDTTVTQVYAYAFDATHKAREAERITDTVVQRLPRELRRQRWESKEALQAQLMSIARAEVAVYNRRQLRAESRRELRAWTRHLVLAATAVATTVYAGVLVL
jgi:hypothetical protein